MIKLTTNQKISNGFELQHYNFVEIMQLAENLKVKFATNAYRLDREGSFPEENLKLLQASGLMNFLIPEEYGGIGGNMTDFVHITKIISSGCLSTSMIWSMHCQQIACIVNNGSAEFKNKYLSRIAENNFYLGSAISEIGKGGHILKALSPLMKENGKILLDRFAPVVTGGPYCDAYLITMKKSPESYDNDIKFLYVEREQVEVKLQSDWKTMGMKSTFSVALSFKGTINEDQIINTDSDFDRIAYESMIPVGHIAWSASWLGSATEALRLMIKTFRDPKNKSQFNLESDLFLEKIARVRLKIDVVNCLLGDTVREYESIFSSTKEKLSKPSFLIRINSLKIISAESLFDAVNELVLLGGFKFGYSNMEDRPLERIFRDLRSASLMIHNNRLLISNGKLTLLDKTL